VWKTLAAIARPSELGVSEMSIDIGKIKLYNMTGDFPSTILAKLSYMKIMLQFPAKFTGVNNSLMPHINDNSPPTIFFQIYFACVL
jgi:hypothetical protein